MRVLLGGDVNLQGRTVSDSAFEHLVPLMGRADLRVVNLEGLLVMASEDPLMLDVPHKPNWRHSGPDMVGALTAAGIDMVSCANNVSFPPTAVLQSLAVLDAAGIAHAGAGSDQAAAHAPAVVERRGLRVGLLAYSSIVFPFGHAAESGRPGIAALRAHTAYVPDARSAEVPGRAPVVRTAAYPQDLERMVREVQAAREICDLLVVSMHWGVPGETLCDYQPAIAHPAIDAGADVIMGHGPHSVHGVEVYRGRPILYSLGNLVFDWPVMRGRHTTGIIATCHHDGNRLDRIELHPVGRDADNAPRSLTGPEGQRVLDLVARLSPRSELQSSPDSLLLALAP